MDLIYKKMSENGRELYLFYPCENQRTPFKTHSITVFLDDANAETCQDALDNWGLRELAIENEIIISFPVAPEGGWNYALDPARQDDIAIFPKLQEGMTLPSSEPPATNEFGIPLWSTMLETWHPIHDSRYLIGVGEGASMALALAAVLPNNIAAVLADGGELSDGALKNAVNAAVPVNLAHCGPKAIEYFKKVNDVDVTTTFPGGSIYSNSINPLQSVTVMNDDAFMGRRLVLGVWEEVFSQVRRPKCGKYGTVDKMCGVRNDPGFEYFIDNTDLKCGIAHTWFTHTPASVKADPHKKVPMMIFCHGGSDNPHEAAEMTQFHVLGEKEGFITVYPWGSDTIMWNAQMNDTPYNDHQFLEDLIEYMLKNYPVDPTRVYISGFSAGGAMAQTFAMTHPQLIAGLCHIDAHWPGSPGADRGGVQEMHYEEHRPIMKALELKKEYDYRMPIWYTYGDMDVAFPILKGKNQQHQYDFWKMFNNIEIKPTPEVDTPELNGCGVIGDTRERFDDPLHPGQWYDVHHFFTKDEEPKNYYNLTILHNKDHDIAHLDAVMGWNYVKQYRRNPDGSVGLVEE